MTQVVLGVGSNIEREKNICAALDELTKNVGDLAVSPVYQSVAEIKPALATTETISGGISATQGDSKDTDFYYNFVVAFDTELSAISIKALLEEIEVSLQRQRNTGITEIVTIDLDLLLYGDWVGELDGNAVPHHDITNYAYVLRPLADLLPRQEHPVYKKSFAELWAEFDKARELLPVDFVWDGCVVSQSGMLSHL